MLVSDDVTLGVCTINVPCHATSPTAAQLLCKQREVK